MKDSGTILDNTGHVIVTDVYGLADAEALANACLIAAAPTMCQGIKDMVQWLKRECADEESFMEGLTGRLEERRDGLAETLRRVQGGDSG